MKGYTRIPNDLIEVLLSPAISGNEMRILLLIARKTYGYKKDTDKISLSQFVDKLGIGRKYINIALKRLQLVSLLILVRRGNSRKMANEWRLDYSNYATKLVSLLKLVSYQAQSTSIRPEANFFHTKESITKEKETSTNRKPLLTEKDSTSLPEYADEIFSKFPPVEEVVK